MSENADAKLSFIYDFYRDMAPYHLTYVYRGDFSKTLNDGILSLSESNLNNISEDSKVKKKVYFIMVESLQNITRHEGKSEEGNPDTTSFFVIQRREKSHLVTSGNIIENSNIESLRVKLEKVNSLSSEDLKEYYKDVLAHGELTEKGGAGLGLIEMARKSGNKLAYDFVKINDSHSYFYFQIRISQEQVEPEKNNPATNSYFDSDIRFHHHLLEQNLNLVYQGRFSQENLKNLLSMIETGLGMKDALPIRKKLFNILVEMLQNIFKHASPAPDLSEGKDGIFIIGKTGKEYRVSVGNLIANHKIAALKEKLEQVNDSNADQLNELYNTVILSENNSDHNGAGLGLIDMKLKSGHNLVYDFTPVDDVNSFFSLAVSIPDRTA